MAKIESSPIIPADIPESGRSLLGDITNDTIWADAVIQYYFGDEDSLSLDATFSDYYGEEFGSTLPDAVYGYANLTTRAFRMIDSVVATDFVETSDIDEADDVLVSVTGENSSDLEGFAYVPGDILRQDQAGEYWSFVAFNRSLADMAAAPEAGGGEYANWTIIHEIGHSVGLLHTHDDESGETLPSVGAAMDNERYSVMSYKTATSGQTAFGHAVSMMALDVAALQALYGEETYASGASRYTLLNAGTGPLDLAEGAVAIGRAYYCIWDSGGVDTLRYGSSGQSVMLNLNAATLDTSGVASDVADVLTELAGSDFYQKLTTDLQAEISDQWRHAGGFFSRVLVEAGSSYSSLDGGFTIANGAVIENAVGGNRADLLIGNAVGNRLSGLAGDDTMLGSGGNDTLLGAAGDDQLMGGFGNDRIRGGAGADVLGGAAGNDAFIYAGIDESGKASDDRDVITDFLGKDFIDLSAIDPSGRKGNQAFKFIGTQEFHDKRGEVRYFVDDDRVTVELDLNGNGRADARIDLLDVTSLNKGDFHL